MHRTISNSLLLALGFISLAPLGCNVGDEGLDGELAEPADPDLDALVLDASAHAIPMPESGLELDAPDGGEAAPTLGGSQSGWWEVVRIQNSEGGTCTATAISDDVLITAAQCIRPTNTNLPVDHVEITQAYGANASAIGAHSSYFIMGNSKWWPFPFVPGNVNHAASNIAFIKFGADTFDYAWTLDHIEDMQETGKWMRVASFGGDDTQTQGWVYPDFYSSDGIYEWMSIPAAQHNTPIDASDLGSPIFSVVDGEKILHGVMSMMSGGSAYYAMATYQLEDHITRGIDIGVPVACVEGYEHAGYSGRSLSFCHEGVLNNILGSDNDFGDTFSARRHANESWLRHELSSLLIPDSMTVGLTDGLRNQTFQTTVAEISTPTVHDLGAYGFDNPAADFSLEWSGVQNSGVHIYLPSTDECFGMRGDPINTTPNIETVACDPNDSNQVFDLVGAGVYRRIEHPASGKCVSFPNVGNLPQGWQIQVALFDCDVGPRPNWRLQEVPGSGDTRDFFLEAQEEEGMCLQRVDNPPGPVIIGGDHVDPDPWMELKGCNANEADQRITLRSYTNGHEGDATTAGFCAAYEGKTVTLRDADGDYMRNASGAAIYATPTSSSSNNHFTVSCHDGDTRAVFRNVSTLRHLMASGDGIWSSGNIYGSNKFDMRAIGNRWQLVNYAGRYIGTSDTPVNYDGVDGVRVEQSSQAGDHTNWIVTIVE